MSIIIEPKTTEQSLIPRNDYPTVRDILGRLGIVTTKRAIASDNFLTGSAGWKLFTDGSIEANSGTFRGTLEAGSIHIPDQTTANSFHTNSDGNSWWGCNVADFASDNDNANAYILKTGVAKLQNVILATSVTLVAGSIQSGSEIAIQGWQQDMVFSSTDYNTLAWALGTITLLDGTTFNIAAGNTGNISDITYIYFSKGASETVLQTTTTASDAVGSNKILIAVAEDSTAGKDINYQVFGGLGGFNKLLTANSIAANTITANEINVSELSALAADLGTITAGNITLDASGYIRGGQTAFNAGVGFFLGYDTDAYKFSIGNPAGNNMTWDGTELETTGLVLTYEFTAGENITEGDVVMLGKVKTTILTCAKDSWTSERNPDTNYKDDNVRTGIEYIAATEYMCDSYYEFPSGQLPGGWLLTANLYLRRSGLVRTGIDADLKLITSAWDESTITWNNVPTRGATITSYSNIEDGWGAADWKSFDVRDALIPTWFSAVADPFYGFSFDATGGTTLTSEYIETYSSEDAGSEPYLIMTHLPYDSKVYIADYAAYATARNVIGIALEDITSGQTGKVQVVGIVSGHNLSFTSNKQGNKGYLGTGGAVGVGNQFEPIRNDKRSVEVGTILDSDSILLNVNTTNPFMIEEITGQFASTGVTKTHYIQPFASKIFCKWSYTQSNRESKGQFWLYRHSKNSHTVQSWGDFASNTIVLSWDNAKGYLLTMINNTSYGVSYDISTYK